MIIKDSLKQAKKLLRGEEGVRELNVQGRCSGGLNYRMKSLVLPSPTPSRAGSYFKPVGERKSLHSLSIGGTSFSSLFCKNDIQLCINVCVWVPFSGSATRRLCIRTVVGWACVDFVFSEAISAPLGTIL